MRKQIVCVALVLLSVLASAQTLKPVRYTDGSQVLNGLVTANAGKKAAGVLILPAWKGIDEEARVAATALAQQGYIAFVADIYGEGNIPVDNAAAAKIAGSYRKDFAAYQKRIALALDELKKAGADADRLAVIGYCFGGTGALETARAGLPVQGVVSIHGGLAKDSSRVNGPLHAKVLVENGADDGGVTPTVMARLTTELNEGNADWQVITYAHSKHTFTDPKSPDYNAVMAKRAWQHTLLFLAEVLK
ncbi:MAG: dienelactone hydrolase family protein [Bacteroidetes bacterium]|mgnify:FL=1|nr:dienelactone hydrolase family protein [Bacteroidota bacterium]